MDFLFLKLIKRYDEQVELAAKLTTTALLILAYPRRVNFPESLI